jgi:hypothetical protein
MVISLRRRILIRPTIRLTVRSTVDDWGRSESIDPDNVGDIADEGMGHRG